MKKAIIICILLIGLFWGNTGVPVKAAHAEDYGIIQKKTKLYAAPSLNVPHIIGETEEQERVEIISILEDFVIIRYKEQYAFIPQSVITVNRDYKSYMGDTAICDSPYSFILTEGEVYQNSLTMLLNAYHDIPLKIREKFEREGFMIIMSERDITTTAYAPYGGYTGIGMVKSVFDYDRKLLFLNDEWPTAIIHEMGHFVNDSLHGFSSLPESNRLYISEAAKISKYGMTNNREYFAEVFRLYITEPQLLKLISAQSYDMMEEAISKFTAL